MRIDNSRAKLFQFCPLAYMERYVYGIEPKTRSNDALDFGTRIHELLQTHYSPTPIPAFPPLPSDTLEGEAQATFEAYKQHWGKEPFEVVRAEQFFEVPLPNPSTDPVYTVTPANYSQRTMCTAEAMNFGGMYGNNTLTVTIPPAPPRHSYIGEFDGIVRLRETGRLALLETKTEKRTSKRNNPSAWASRSQVGLYLWAAEQIYGEEFETIILNVITRQSPGGREPAIFRRDHLVRTEAQKREAVSNIVWVADQIEETQRRFGNARWPQVRENCHNGFWACDYADLHVTPERSEELVKIKFRPAEEYLAF